MTPPLQQTNLCSVLTASWNSGERILAKPQPYSKTQGQVLVSSVGLLNAPMSNPDPQDEIWGSENTEEENVPWLTIPNGHSLCRVTAFSREQMENGGRDLAKRRKYTNIAMQDCHRHSVKKQLCDSHLCLSTLFWLLFHNLT